MVVGNFWPTEFWFRTNVIFENTTFMPPPFLLWRKPFLNLQALRKVQKWQIWANTGRPYCAPALVYFNSYILGSCIYLVVMKPKSELFNTMKINTIKIVTMNILKLLTYKWLLWKSLHCYHKNCETHYRGEEFLFLTTLHCTTFNM